MTLFWGKRPIFQIAFAVSFKEINILSHARWAPTSYKQAYYSTYKGYITPVTHLFSAICRGGPYVTPFGTCGTFLHSLQLATMLGVDGLGEKIPLASVVTPLLRRERL